MRYFFLKTHLDDSRIRIRPLANQTHEEYGEINTELNVAVSFRPMIDILKIGTVVAVTDLTQCVGFYAVNTPTYYIMSADYIPEEAIEQYSQLKHIINQ